MLNQDTGIDLPGTFTEQGEAIMEHDVEIRDGNGAGCMGATIVGMIAQHGDHYCSHGCSFVFEEVIIV